MKNSIRTIFAAFVFILALASCQQETNDFNDRLANLEDRVSKLEKLCAEMNTNISSLQGIVSALQNQDYITAVNELTSDGKVIGYTINFAKGQPITIYHGKDGVNGKDGADGKDGTDGKDGQNGKDGADGKDGSTPVIGVKQDTDGVWYWTLNGEWLLDDNGQKIKAVGTDGKNGQNGKDGQNGQDGTNGQDGQDGKDGKDGITPQLKIEEGYWYVSTDNGQTWTQLGKATGENGKDGVDGKDGKDGVDGVDGDSMFQSVTVTETEVTFVTSDGQTFVLKRASALSIEFDTADLVVMGTNSTRNIHYTITSGVDNITIEALSSADIKVKVVKTDAKTGSLQVKTGATIDEYSKVVVLVNNGSQAIMRTLNFEEEAIEVEENTTKEVSHEGGDVTLEFFSNVPCHAVVPEDAQSWISVAPETKGMERQTIRLIVQPNTGAARSATVIVQSEDGSIVLSFLIEQRQKPASKALLPYDFLPNEIDKTTITEAYFHVSDPTTTATIISEGDSEYEPIYFEKVGTVVHYYTTGEVYKCYGVNFWGWQSLRSLDLSMFDISDVQFLQNTFRDCFNLRSLNLSSFDTSNVTYFSYMFYNCLSLKELNLTGFDTSKAIDMSYMFADCKSLSNLDVRGFNTGLVTDFDGMFGDCSNLKQLDVSNFDTSSATDMTSMFSGLSLTSIDVSNFNTSNVVRASGLFSNCWNLQEIDVSHFDTRKMEIMSYMFAGCRSLVHLDLTSFDFASVQYMDGMFKNSSNLKEIEMPSSTTPSLLMTHYMFEGCNSLEHIDLSFFDTRNVTTMIQMFRGCSSLRALDLSSFNVEHVSSFWGLFDGCRNLEYLNISSFNPANISDAKEMFYNTRKLTKLDLGDFDISLSSDNTGIGHWLGELAKQCHIRCTQATKDALIAASSLLSNSKYTWYTDGSSLPNVDYENEDGLYCSSDYSKDKTVRTIQLASEGAGIDLVVMGDAYSDRLIDDGTYDADMEKAIDAIFAVEPYKSFKHLFNIYIVYAVSENEVIGKSTALSCFNEGSPIGSEGWIWKAYYASAAKVSSPGECSPVVIMNSAISDGAATGFLSIAPDYMNDPLRDDYHGGVSEAVAYISGPNDARFDYIVRHEFGHSFGFLMDEYSKYSGAITSWDIESWQCCFAYGMWKNVDLVSDNTVKWAKFINDPRYADTGIGVYEGALYETGAWRPSPESVMNSTDSGFNAPSREAIYYKIHKLAYGRDWNYNFEDFVTYDLPNINADKARLSAPKARMTKATSSINRNPVFKKSSVTGPDGKERIKIEMN